MNVIMLSKTKLTLAGILLIGIILRIYDINWDQNQHLHPDERFLTMVAGNMKAPSSFFAHIDPQQSLMNPANIGFKFFVYGTFPIILNKLIGLQMNTDSYNLLTLQGRLLSAIFDTTVIFLIYKSAEIFQKRYSFHKSIKIYASFFYAILVLPIQLSHFFTVDTFLNFFMFSSFYFILKFSIEKNWMYIFCSAVFFGLAISSKVSAVFILPLNIGLLIFFVNDDRKKELRSIFSFYYLKTFRYKYTALILLFYTITSYFSVRIFDPYLFIDSNFLNFVINPLFYENIKALKAFEGNDTWFPPAIQWINKAPIIFSLYNLVVWGMGIFSFFFLLYGVFCIIKKKYWLLFAIVLWTIVFFTYQSLQFVKTMRYYIFLYPFFAIFISIGLHQLICNKNKIYKMAIFLLLLVYPLSFIGIYTKPHTRTIASEWIYKNLPDNSYILGEYWDDNLPLPVSNSQKKFYIDSLHVFDQDTPEKWSAMEKLLNKGDYIVLASNRGWGSILSVADRYPKMSKFYLDLFAGKLPYKKIKEFTSYPSLEYLGIPLEFNDENADEAFTVYDHPRVMIFKKSY